MIDSQLRGIAALYIARIVTTVCCSFFLLSHAHAGRYPVSGIQQFTYPIDTTNLGDGTVIDSNDGVASIKNNPGQGTGLRLTRDGNGDTLSSFKIPDLDPGKELTAFETSFLVSMTAQDTPADGWSLNFGSITAGDNGSGEGGFQLNQGLVIAFDTYDNGNDTPSIEVYADGISIGNFPQTFIFDSTARLLRVTWDSAGLDITWNGVSICTNLPTPGFVPMPGNIFAFSGRTGGATQTTILDNMVISTTPATPFETGGPVISEFLASNEDGLEDEDGDSADWVEIYNGQNTIATMTGWKLSNTNGGPSWTLPNFTIPPYGYTVIYCSGKNRSNPSSPLHANFTLANTGGTLSLILPNDTVASTFAYGIQSSDIAYGQQGPPVTLGYLNPPTPGRKNTAAQAVNGPAEDVEYLSNGQPSTGGLFSSSFQVTFKPLTVAGAVIRYTLDNTPPSANSQQWTPGVIFTVTESTTLRARAFLADSLPGKISSRTWLKLDESLTNYNSSNTSFSSHLPIVVIDSFGTPVDDYNQPGNRPFRLSYAIVIDRDPLATAPNTNRSLIQGKVDVQGRCGTRVRGETSAGFDQRSYAWEFWDNDNNDKDVSILGQPTESDWVLHGPFTDKTLMRNYTAYQSMRDFRGEGSAMRTRFVEVFFNQQEGEAVSSDDYKGIYVLVEKIKRDKNRVDIEKLNDLMTDPAIITGGYIFKHDKPSIGNSSLNTSGDSSYPGINFQGVTPEIWNTAQQNYLQNHLNEFESALYGSSFDNPTTGYANYIDADSFIDNQWWIEITKQIDGYRISQYFSKDRGGKIKSLPIWDYNLSLSNADYLNGWEPTGWYYPQLGFEDYYWYPRLHQDPAYQRRHWDRYWQMRGSIWSTSAISNRIDLQTSELLGGSTTPVTNDMPLLSPLSENAAMRHFRKYPLLGNYVWPNAPSYETRTTFNGNNNNNQPGEVEHMKNWLSARLAWIDDQNTNGTVIYRPLVFTHSAGSVSAGTQLGISRFSGSTPSGRTYAVGGTIYYTVDGSDPAGTYPNLNSVSATATAYTGTIPLNSSRVVNARLLLNGVWSPLRSASFIVSAAPASSENLVVSEIHYSPSSANTGEVTAGFSASDFEYIELLNVSSGSIDLSACDFTTGIGFDFDLASPITRTLPAGGRIIVVGNTEAYAMRYGSGATIAGQYSGNLNNSGERVTLTAANSSIIASFTYGVTGLWPPASSGYSIVLNNPRAGLPFGSGNTWRASAQIGGTPGAPAGSAFAGNPSGDFDNDGLSDFLEYALGSSQANASIANRPITLLTTHTVNSASSNHLTLIHQRNLAADGVNYIVEFSVNLTSWGSSEAEVIHVSTVNQNNGTATITYRSTRASAADARQFMRLRVTP
jgi:CotH kinase protein/Lamin Tail Domain/Chitobiase/beta-hexosaminidase C-terminal domain